MNKPNLFIDLILFCLFFTCFIIILTIEKIIKKDLN